jgi:hypothetical protein
MDPALFLHRINEKYNISKNWNFDIENTEDLIVLRITDIAEEEVMLISKDFIETDFSNPNFKIYLELEHVVVILTFKRK